MWKNNSATTLRDLVTDQMNVCARSDAEGPTGYFDNAGAATRHPYHPSLRVGLDYAWRAMNLKLRQRFSAEIPTAV
jgi:hypothetical protein